GDAKRVRSMMGDSDGFVGAATPGDLAVLSAELATLGSNRCSGGLDQPGGSVTSTFELVCVNTCKPGSGQQVSPI
ncbi:MAG: hypothetical protein ACXVH1_31995, partial [Solirubrobacteraceae bacterium]